MPIIEPSIYLLFLKAFLINNFSINFVVSGEIALQSTEVMGFEINCDKSVNCFATCNEELGGIIDTMMSLFISRSD